MANKDAFTRYSSAYPDFVEAVRFEEARERSLQPGQEGQALVGFGDFKFETLQSLYESEDSPKIRFVNYLRRKVPAPGMQMENAIRYIKSRDRQRAAAAAAASSTSTTAAASATASSTANVKAAIKAKSALQYCRQQKEQGTGIVSAPAVSVHPLPPSKGLSSVQVGREQPYHFHVPEDQQPGPSSRGLPQPLPPPPPGHAEDQPGTSAGLLPPPPPATTTLALDPAALPPPLPVEQRVPRTTAYRKRKAAEAAAAGFIQSWTMFPRQSGQYTCTRCGQLKRIETGHTRIAGVSYCAAVGGKTVEEWREEMKKKKKGGGVQGD